MTTSTTKLDKLLNTRYVPDLHDGFLDFGRIRRLYGHHINLDYGTMMANAKVGYSRTYRDIRLSLDDVKRAVVEDPVKKLAAKVVALLNLCVDEYLLQNHIDPRKVEIIRLAKLFIAGQRRTLSGDYRFGKLSVFNTDMGITIRLLQPENAERVPSHDLVYTTTRSYSAQDDLGLEHPPSVEGTWAPEFADEALDLLRQATVLDVLAGV